MTLHHSHWGWFLAAGCAAALAGEPAPAAKPAGTPGLPPRMQQVRARIEALFADRSLPPAAPSLVDNPFRPAGALPVMQAPVPGDAGGGAPPAVAGSDAEVLQQAVATLRVTGIFDVGGVTHLVINSRPYKAGDVLQVAVGGQTVYLRIRDVAPNRVTLALHDAEATLKY